MRGLWISVWSTYVQTRNSKSSGFQAVSKVIQTKSGQWKGVTANISWGDRWQNLAGKRTDVGHHQSLGAWFRLRLWTRLMAFSVSFPKCEPQKGRAVDNSSLSLETLAKCLAWEGNNCLMNEQTRQGQPSFTVEVSKGKKSESFSFYHWLQNTSRTYNLAGSMPSRNAGASSVAIRGHDS